MTYLALSLSNYVNGVAKLHGEVSRQMFPNVPIEAITMESTRPRGLSLVQGSL